MGQYDLIWGIREEITRLGLEKEFDKELLETQLNERPTEVQERWSKVRDEVVGRYIFLPTDNGHGVMKVKKEKK